MKFDTADSSDSHFKSDVMLGGGLVCRYVSYETDIADPTTIGAIWNSSIDENMSDHLCKFVDVIQVKLPSTETLRRLAFVEAAVSSGLIQLGLK